MGLTKELAATIESCPRREVVARSGKQWWKTAWGPPAQVKVDVQKTNSLVKPYLGLVEFSLVIAYGPKRNTREDAAKDSELRPFLTGRYRNLYEIGKDGGSLADRLVLSSGQWEHRPELADACWDHVTGAVESTK